MAQIFQNSGGNNETEVQLTHCKSLNYVSGQGVVFNQDINAKSNLIIIDKPPAFDHHVHNNNQHSNKNRRIIELSDQKSKMDLRREFRLDEMQKIDNVYSDPSCGTLHNNSPTNFTVYGSKKILLPKLPAGTILIEHNNNTNPKELLKTSITPVAIKRKTEKSYIKKFKSIHQPEKNIHNSRIRRNPVRETIKKINDGSTRPRLLAAKRCVNNDNHTDHVTDKKQTKSFNVPYMNTRSLTKKMYNVGASHQVPTIEDEIEWREWPIHGMHERPIYHPQMGLAVECNGHHFISLDGCSYQKIPQPRFEQTSDPKKKQFNNLRLLGDSFDNHIYDSLHSVLGYAVQITMPKYKKLLDNYKKKYDDEKSIGIKLRCLKEHNLIRNIGVKPSKVQTTEPPLNLKCIKNHAKLQKVLKGSPKNTLVLLKTTDPSLNKNQINTSELRLDTLASVKMDSDFDSDRIFKQNCDQPSVSNLEKYMNNLVKNPVVNSYNDEIFSVPQPDMQNDLSTENWLNDLISDTALLYCAASGMHQDDFAMYLNTLDVKQCVNWINSRY